METQFSKKREEKNEGKSPRNDEHPQGADNPPVSTSSSAQEDCQRACDADKREVPMTDYFVMALHDDLDEEVVRSACSAALDRGPQPVGTIHFIGGVLVKWMMRNHYGGDPELVNKVKLEKAAAPAGNAELVRPLPPQVPPPQERPI